MIASPSLVILSLAVFTPAVTPSPIPLPIPSPVSCMTLLSCPISDLAVAFRVAMESLKVFSMAALDPASFCIAALMSLIPSADCRILTSTRLSAVKLSVLPLSAPSCPPSADAASLSACKFAIASAAPVSEISITSLSAIKNPPRCGGFYFGLGFYRADLALNSACARAFSVRAVTCASQASSILVIHEWKSSKQCECILKAS